MATLLVVLKIAGVILLIPVSLIIIIALLLCVPIRYTVVINYEDNLTCSAKITYFLRIISFTVTYNDKRLRTALKIFGHKFRKKGIKSSNGRFDKDSNGKTTRKSAKFNSEMDSDTTEHTSKFKKKRTKTKRHSTKAPESDEGMNEPKKSLKEAISSKISHVKNLIEDYNIKEIIAVTLKYLKKLIKACVPAEFKTVSRIGFDDPYFTGVLLAAVYPILGLFGIVENVDLTGSPYGQEFEIKANIKGNLYVIRIVVLICMYLLSKPIRPFVIQYFFGKDDTE